MSSFHTFFGSTEHGWYTLGGCTLRAKIQTTLRMWTVSITPLERWIENGKFNLDHKAEGEYSRSTAILVILNPNNQGTGLKCTSVGLIVRHHNGQVGQIEDILKLIAYTHSQLQENRPSSDHARQTFCIIVGITEDPWALPQIRHSAPLIRCHSPIRMTRRG